MRSTITIRVCSVLVGFAVAMASGFALGQADPFHDAGGKIRGDMYWPSKAATRHIETARGYAQDFQTYVAKTPKLEPSVVADVKVQLGHYLDDAAKHLATMKKDFAKVSHVKPMASRDDSAELFVLAMGFRG